jgi:hypothetical protein
MGQPLHGIAGALGKLQRLGWTGGWAFHRRWFWAKLVHLAAGSLAISRGKLPIVPKALPTKSPIFGTHILLHQTYPSPYLDFPFYNLSRFPFA